MLHETAAVSAQVLCTPYSHAPCHFMQSHIRKVYACLAVTCHLHFWQNDRDLLRATVVTRGWNGYRNKSQHRKSTLEKKFSSRSSRDSNPRPFNHESGALTTELSPPHNQCVQYSRAALPIPISVCSSFVCPSNGMAARFGILGFGIGIGILGFGIGIEILGFVTCAQMLMHAIDHWGCTATVKESALKGDSGRKIPCRTWDSNPRQTFCVWLFSWTLYQLSHSGPTTQTLQLKFPK